jgi:meiotic recombination protein SPO11
MLEWDVCAEDGPEPAWRDELQKMLMLNIKAEMQVLENLPGGIALWLEQQIGTQLEGPTSYEIGAAPSLMKSTFDIHHLLV